MWIPGSRPRRGEWATRGRGSGGGQGEGIPAAPVPSHATGPGLRAAGHGALVNETPPAQPGSGRSHNNTTSSYLCPASGLLDTQNEALGGSGLMAELEPTKQHNKHGGTGPPKAQGHARESTLAQRNDCRHHGTGGRTDPLRRIPNVCGASP